MLCTWGISALMLTALVVAFFALIAGKVDYDWYGAWWIVFIPVWIFDAAFLFFGIPSLVKSVVHPNTHSHQPQTADQDDATQPQRRPLDSSSSSSASEASPEQTDSENGATHAQVRADKKLKRKTQRRRIRASLSILYFLLLVAFQILIVLGLQAILNTSWALLFLPYWILE